MTMFLTSVVCPDDVTLRDLVNLLLIDKPGESVSLTRADTNLSIQLRVRGDDRIELTFESP